MTLPYSVPPLGPEGLSNAWERMDEASMVTSFLTTLVELRFPHSCQGGEEKSSAVLSAPEVTTNIFIHI